MNFEIGEEFGLHDAYSNGKRRPFYVAPSYPLATSPRHGPGDRIATTIPSHCRFIAWRCCFVVVESSGGRPSTSTATATMSLYSSSAALPRRLEEGGREQGGGAKGAASRPLGCQWHLRATD